MKQGKVKWYNKEKGYGFIEAEGEKDYFVNKYNIEDKEYLEEGDKVDFEVSKDKLEAINVKLIENEEYYIDIINEDNEITYSKGFCGKSIREAIVEIADLIRLEDRIEVHKLDYLPF